MKSKIHTVYTYNNNDRNICIFTKYMPCLICLAANIDNNDSMCMLVV